MRWFKIGIQSGEAVTHGRHRVVPQSLVAWLRIPWPGGGNAFVYQLPVALEVQTGDAAARRIPIVDLTRFATIGMLLAALVSARIIWRIRHE